jgi:hypothetical protein
LEQSTTTTAASATTATAVTTTPTTAAPSTPPTVAIITTKSQRASASPKAESPAIQQATATSSASTPSTTPGTAALATSTTTESATATSTATSLPATANINAINPLMASMAHLYGQLPVSQLPPQILASLAASSLANTPQHTLAAMMSNNAFNINQLSTNDLYTEAQRAIMMVIYLLIIFKLYYVIDLLTYNYYSTIY